MAPRLREKYETEIVPFFKEQFSIGNRLAVPRLEKIVVNMGVGKANENAKILDSAMKDLSAITGQQPAVRKARRSVAGFKLREGTKVGCMVTLRGNRMYEFLDRLISVVIPRFRDFRGLSPNSFDGRGNYNMGIAEQSVFLEVKADKVEHFLGMDIAFVTTAGSNEHGFALLDKLGMPFRK